ncbi:domain-containing 11-like [Octopus vulgaris]|uniref:UBX domain-containing protein 11 n=2 Tax=Octopus vulgaris TaxID=6645 RepID=A0AA36FH27_OCTVU|nr:domain-containing 11-like [Octopus vulgaris]
MSSPLSSLKRYSKLPLPGHMRKVNLPIIPDEEKETNNLIDDVTADMLKSLLDKESRRSLPNVNFPSTSTGSPLCSEKELLSLMASRLSTAEARLKLQKEELMSKEKRILYLERKVHQLEKQCNESPDEVVASLTHQCDSFQNQIREMEDFLYDYGLIWVGEARGRRKRSLRRKSSTGTYDPCLWSPEESIPEPSLKVDYDVIIENIKELNLLAGEGVANVESTKDGARLKYTEPATMTLYKNGIFLLNGPFRSLSDPATRRCLYDIMEGYFPSELQSTYPEGIPLKVIDNRNIEYTMQPSSAFPGIGQLLNGTKNDTPCLHTHRTLRSASSLQHMTQPHEPRLSADQFIRKLPGCVIKDGNSIEVKKSIESLLKSPPKPRQLTIIETLVEKEKCTMSQSPTQAHVEPDVANIRVKSETGDCTYLIKMKYLDTIGDLRVYLDTHRPAFSPSYKILSTFPRRVLDDPDATIEECGLVPTATLVLELDSTANY